MGAWGCGVFENDDAATWVADLEHASNMDVLAQVIGAIVDVQHYLSASDCSRGLAAAEVVAALLGRPPLELPEEVTDFVDRVDVEPPGSLVIMACRAIDKIGMNSELKDLWEEGDEADLWRDSLADLRRRLNCASVS
jgi:hypothetical protein